MHWHPNARIDRLQNLVDALQKEKREFTESRADTHNKLSSHVRTALLAMHRRPSEYANAIYKTCFLNSGQVGDLGAVEAWAAEAAQSMASGRYAN